MGSTPRFARHVEPLFPSLTELFAAGEAVGALIAHPGWSHVVDMLKAEIETIDSELDGQSQPLSQAEYAMKHGRRGGLLGALEAVGAILQRYNARLAEQRDRHESGAGSPQEV